MFKWFVRLTKLVKQDNWLETAETRSRKLGEQMDALPRTSDGLREEVKALEKTLEEIARKAEGICRTVSAEIEKQNREVETALSLCRRQVEACAEIANGVSVEINGLSETIQSMNG